MRIIITSHIPIVDRQTKPTYINSLLDSTRDRFGSTPMAIISSRLLLHPLLVTLQLKRRCFVYSWKYAHTPTHTGCLSFSPVPSVRNCSCCVRFCGLSWGLMKSLKERRQFQAHAHWYLGVVRYSREHKRERNRRIGEGIKQQSMCLLIFVVYWEERHWRRRRHLLSSHLHSSSSSAPTFGNNISRSHPALIFLLSDDWRTPDMCLSSSTLCTVL